MNAIGFLRSTEYIGAKELRTRLDSILREGSHPYRVMLRNKPAVAIIPDAQFLQLLEVLEELRGAGLLKQALRRLQAQSRKKSAWFWSAAWQEGEAEVDRAVAAGAVRRAKGVKTLLKDLKK